MSWNQQIPYSSSGGFMDFFESLTYEHVNFIFADAQNFQESMYPSMNTNLYKYGQSEAGSMSYYDYSNGYVVGHHMPANDGYIRHMENSSAIHDQRGYVVGHHMPANDGYIRHMENSSAIHDQRAAALHTQQDGNPNFTSQAAHVDCPRNHHTRDYQQTVWQDNVDPDSMTYEELLELGEAVGTQSRGLSEEQISMLPVSKFKCGFFSRKRSRDERCVICQMEYKRRDRRITLPCKHAYHAGCGRRWLSINKACPICYKEVFVDASKP